MRKHLFIIFLFSTFQFAYSQSGIVFRDSNGNGIKDTNEQGLPNFTVKSYTNNGIGDQLFGSATTDALGNYTLSPSAGAGDKVRVEFDFGSSCIINKSVDYEAQKGINYGTGVQFVTGSQTGVNFGIYNPKTEYVTSSNPILYTSVYNAGSINDASTQQSSAIMGFKQLYEGIPGDTINAQPGIFRPQPSQLAVFKDVGTTWGIAYSKYANKVFTSAFMKRYAGLGPLGSGGIYMIDPTQASNSNVSNFLSLDDDLNIATQGTGTYVPLHPGFSPIIGTDSQRKLKGIVDLTNDPAAFGQVGKVSLGGLELSDDGRYLFSVNLYDKKVYRFDLKDAYNPQKPTNADVKVYNAAPWLTASCPNGESRPFGIKYHRGKLYVGAICTGENLGKSVEQFSASSADQVLSGSVYEIDPEGTGTGSEVLSIPLIYPKNLASQGDNGLLRGWFNWTDNFNQVTYSHGAGQDSTWTHPQPILCDIEFDVEGSMIISFADRAGHQLGWRNYRPTLDTINKVSCTVSGEVLRAWKNPTSCSFELESNGTAGPYTTAGANKTFTLGGYIGPYQHPLGQGEFYFGDDAYTTNKTRPWHGESVIGGIAISPATGELIAAAFDPLDGRTGKPYSGIANGLRASFSGGSIRLSNTTGDKLSGYSVYTSAGFGKAAGIGDMELVGNLAPISIGNRIWDDVDSDGIQDPDEDGIDGIVIELYKNNLKVGETVSSAGGQWFFDSTNVILNAATGIEPDTDYEVRIDTSLFKDNGKGILSNYFLTKKGENGAGAAGVSDSDAEYNNGIIVVSVKTGELGYTNYNLDIGMTQNPPCSFITSGLDSIQCNNNGTLADESDDFISFVLNPTGLNMWVTYDVTVNSGTISPSNGLLGENTKFNLQAGSAGKGDVIVTITNPIDTTCKMQITIKDPGGCGYICPDTSYSICPGDIFRLEIEDPSYTQVQWFVDNGNGAQPIIGANNITYDATEPGKYTYSAIDGNGCNASQCCPTILVAGSNCCKPKICGPVKITKKK